jgi:hypothetical protein
MIHLNPNTVPSNSKKKPTIAITKLGVFSISQTAVERAGFKEGDHVAFSFDDKSKTGSGSLVEKIKLCPKDYFSIRLVLELN